MSKISLAAVTAAALCFGLPAYAQNADPSLDKLPPGPERQMLQRACTSCHTLERVATGDHDRNEWNLVVDGMVNVGAPLTPEEIPQLKAYLAKIPAQKDPVLKVMPGPVKVTIKEWQVPTSGSRPHDPLAMADGSLWYTGHRASVLGRLDPATGKITEFKTRIPASGPHGLAADTQGNVWFTGNFKGYIGKLDPKTGQVTEYRMPDPAARDPHTPLFDKTGNLWFTVQGGNMVGRLDPKSGEIKLATMPTPRSLPYGMVVNSKNLMFFDMFGTNKMASIDSNMKVTEYALPNAASRPRRIAITSDDAIWYSDFSRGYIGRLDPATGKVTEWASPSGPKSEPYGIAVIDDIIWYVEANAKPNGLVRFDPKTQAFQSFPIPSGGGVVRNMMPTTDGKGLVMALSAQDKVGIATIQ